MSKTSQFLSLAQASSLLGIEVGFTSESGYAFVDDVRGHVTHVDLHHGVVIARLPPILHLLARVEETVVESGVAGATLGAALVVAVIVTIATFTQRW